MPARDHDKWQIGDAISRTWFSGEVVDSGAPQPLELSPALTSPIEIRRSTTTSRLVWRRNLAHIESDRARIHIIWLLLAGRMKITGPNGVHLLTADNLAIMTHDVPFIVESENTAENPLISLTISVPAHIMQPHIDGTRHLGVPYPSTGAEGRVARDLFETLLENGQSLGREIRWRLAGCAVQCIGNIIRAGEPGPEQADPTAGQIEQVLAVISASISDPELSGEAICARCGISRRQLHYLLKRHGHTLADLVWKQRLRNVADWLGDPGMASVPISELAFAAGHKNYEHFCRSFKAMYGASPREYRNRRLAH